MFIGIQLREKPVSILGFLFIQGGTGTIPAMPGHLQD